MNPNTSYDNNQPSKTDDTDEVKWYVMRDLSYPRSKSPAYKILKEAGFEVFTPMKQKMTTIKCVKVCEETPFIHDLLFVRSTKRALDTKVDSIRTLQYRYVRGGKHCEGMTVDERSMSQFINAIKNTTKYNLYQPSELSDNQIGASIKIIGGVFDGYEGNLLKIQGSKKKRLLIKLDNYIVASIEVESEYVKLT